MLIFWRLVLAHLLTDFTLQTNFIAAWKRKNVWGAMAHAAVFFITGLVLCYGYLTDTWVSIGSKVVIQGWMAILVLTIFHFMEDEWRVWTIQKLNTPDSFPFFLWDQFIHLIFIFVFVPINSELVSEKWVILSILFILLTHFSTIFIYYFERLIKGESSMPVEKKYVSMFFRVLTASLILLPGKFVFLSIISILMCEFIMRVWHKNGFSWINSAIGHSSAVFIGIIARFLYY